MIWIKTGPGFAVIRYCPCGVISNNWDRYFLESLMKLNARFAVWFSVILFFSEISWELFLYLYSSSNYYHLWYIIWFCFLSGELKFFFFDCWSFEEWWWRHSIAPLDTTETNNKVGPNFSCMSVSGSVFYLNGWISGLQV